MCVCVCVRACVCACVCACVLVCVCVHVCVSLCEWLYVGISTQDCLYVCVFTESCLQIIMYSVSAEGIVEHIMTMFLLLFLNVLCVCRKGRCWFTRYLMSYPASTAGHPKTVSASWKIQKLCQVTVACVDLTWVKVFNTVLTFLFCKCWIETFSIPKFCETLDLRKKALCL